MFQAGSKKEEVEDARLILKVRTVDVTHSTRSGGGGVHLLHHTSV
jgi:hypothetical protein